MFFFRMSIPLMHNSRYAKPSLIQYECSLYVYLFNQRFTCIFFCRLVSVCCTLHQAAAMLIAQRHEHCSKHKIKRIIVCHTIAAGFYVSFMYKWIKSTSFSFANYSVGVSPLFRPEQCSIYQSGTCFRSSLFSIQLPTRLLLTFHVCHFFNFV